MDGVRSHHVLLGLAMVVLLGGLLASAHLPSSDVRVRSMTDPHIMSHYLAILPFCIAVYKRMPVTAAAVLLATFVSILYHLDYEANTTAAFAYTDMFMAPFNLAWFAILLGVTWLYTPYDRTLFGLTLALSVSALVLYGLPKVLGMDLNNDGVHDVRDEDCQYNRIHPLWHLGGFLAMTLVLWNFSPRKGMAKARTDWQRRVLDFHY